jgi:hypothetical protein
MHAPRMIPDSTNSCGFRTERLMSSNIPLIFRRYIDWNKLTTLPYNLKCSDLGVWHESLGLWLSSIVRNPTPPPPKKKSSSVALSPQVNYTDWSTATCRRNLVPTFVDRGVSRSRCGGSLTVVNLSFLDRSRYFFSSSASLIFTRAEWTPFQTYCYSENLVAPGIEHGTSE